MKRTLSLFIAFILLLPAFIVPAEAAKKSSCENGECIPRLVDRLEDLGKLYKRECLPKGIKNQNVDDYIKKNGLSEQCWRYLTEVNHLEKELLSHQNRLEARLGCEGKNCKLSSPGESLNSQLANISRVKQKLSCTETKKRQIRNSCGSDMNCVLLSSALGVGGYLAQMLVPQKARPKNCHLGKDSCVTNLATGFLKSAFTFFKGAWDLLKMAGRKVKQQMGKFWNWVRGAEKHSSTSQLAMAKASKDPGVFRTILKDFPGTMKKIWAAFVGAINDWLKNKVFCQKWSGTPQFSRCLEPTESFDCIPCKTMVTGLCTVTGTIVAEIVPAFLSGGLITAVKHGVNGASKISRLFKVSNASMKTMQRSRIGKVALQTSNKLDDSLKISKGLQAAKVAVQASLNAISKYLLSPTRKLLKTSFSFLSNSVKKSHIYIAESPAGKVLNFTGTTAKTGLKVILYPIDNPMTVLAYKAGVRSFERVVKLGSPKLGSKTFITSSAIQKNAQLEGVLARLEMAKMPNRPDPQEILKLEEELLSKISGDRTDILKGALLDEDTQFSDIVSHLYPELQYGSLARKLPPEKVLAAEKEFFLEIQRLPNGPKKELWLDKLKKHVSYGESRNKIVGNSRHPFDPEIKVGIEKTAAQEKFNKVLTPEELASKESVNKLTDNLQNELIADGLKTEKMIKTSTRPVVYDVVAVGAGPNNAAAVSVIRETNPNLNVLVIEATEDMGTFNKIKGFDINTPEFIGNSGNTIPGSSVQLKDYNITDASFASAEDLGNLTVGTYKSADPDMIFNNKVIKWEKEPTPGAWPAKYRVETSNGVVVYTNSGLAGTGFGPPITRLKDPSSIDLVTKYEDELRKTDLSVKAKYSPKVTSVDDFLTIATNDVKLGREAMARYKGKKVLVIGSGDGGNIAVEGTAGLNRNLNPKELNTGVETIWLGQESKNGKEFIESMTTRKNLRYSRIAESMDEGKIKPVNGYLAKVEEFVNEAGEKQFKAYYTTKEGKAISEPIIADNLVFATGYPNNHSTLTPIFQSMAKNGNTTGDEIVFNSLNGRVDEFTRYDEFKTDSEITKQLSVNGSPEDVYATGVFAKTPISDEEWKIPTGGFLDITAPKAAATGKLIAQKLTPQKISKSEMHTLLKVGTGEPFEFLKRPMRSIRTLTPLDTPPVADIYTKIELGKSLRPFTSKPNSTFKISIWKGIKGFHVYRVTGLEEEAAKQIANALSNNAKLSHGIESQLLLGRTRLDIEVPVRSTGTINIENMVFTPVSIALAKEIYVPMSIQKGVSKFVSPSLKSAGQDKEEQNRE